MRLSNSIERTKKRIAFVTKNYQLTRFLYRIYTDHTHTMKELSKSANGKLLIDLARTHLGYSCRTNDQDILRNLLKTYHMVAKGENKYCYREGYC